MNFVATDLKAALRRSETRRPQKSLIQHSRFPLNLGLSCIRYPFVSNIAAHLCSLSGNGGDDEPIFLADDATSQETATATAAIDTVVGVRRTNAFNSGEDTTMTRLLSQALSGAEKTKLHGRRFKKCGKPGCSYDVARLCSPCLPIQGCSSSFATYF